MKNKGMMLLGGWLDLVILEVYSNLWFYDSMKIKSWTTGVNI